MYQGLRRKRGKVERLSKRMENYWRETPIKAADSLIHERLAYPWYSLRKVNTGYRAKKFQ